MTIRAAINGYGRIGRNILKALYENNYRDRIEIVAVNDLNVLEASAHLTKYDSTHGPFKAEVQTGDGHLIINGDRIQFYSERDPANLPWKADQIDVVFECTGKFTTREKAQAHLLAGAKKVIISAPATNVDATIVFGVNHEILSAHHEIISNASCTTNCLAPIVKILQEHIGIESGLMNTIHAYTNDQTLVDSQHSDLRRARAAAHSIIPTKTGAASAVGLVLPELNGKLDGLSLRVPVMNVSLVDFTFISSRQTTAQEIDRLMIEASQGPLKNVLAVNREPLVSCDFNHSSASAIYDATQTKVIGNNVKLLAWYDNEWGFSNRMLDVTQALFSR